MYKFALVTFGRKRSIKIVWKRAKYAFYGHRASLYVKWSKHRVTLFRKLLVNEITVITVTLFLSSPSKPILFERASFYSLEIRFIYFYCIEIEFVTISYVRRGNFCK